MTPYEAQARAARLAIVYQKSINETLAAMQRYAERLPCGWDAINWEGIDLRPYFLNADNVLPTDPHQPRRPTAICETSRVMEVPMKKAARS